jgi:nucleotide-binding universal stress UspA family protein
MKTILVPIDFSKNAKHAADYALMVAKQTNAKLCFLYVNAPPLVPEYNLPAGMEQYLAQNQLEAIENMSQFVTDFTKKSKLPADRIDHKIEYGFTAEKIVNVAETIGASLIVMGTKGVSDAFDQWIGTVAQKVMKISNCPVWIIPDKISVHYPKKFIYAADFEKDELSTKHKIYNFVKLFDAECKIVHLVEKADDFENPQILVLQEKLEEDGKNKDTKTTYINETNIVDGLDSFIKANKPDVLVLAHYEKSFLTKIFEKSVTKYFVQKANLPILIVHKDDNLFFG